MGDVKDCRKVRMEKGEETKPAWVRVDDVRVVVRLGWRKEKRQSPRGSVDDVRVVVRLRSVRGYSRNGGDAVHLRPRRCSASAAVLSTTAAGATRQRHERLGGRRA